MPRKANDQGRALSAALAKDQARTLLEELEPLGTEEGRAGLGRMR